MRTSGSAALLTLGVVSLLSLLGQGLAAGDDMAATGLMAGGRRGNRGKRKPKDGKHSHIPFLD